MAKIYTKTGDEGKTGLIGGRKISKGELRIEAYGTVDELNSWIGLIRDSVSDDERIATLKEIQNLLFNIGSHLAADTGAEIDYLPVFSETMVEDLELKIDEMEDKLPVLKHFVLPGGHFLISYTHLARTVCRRAERCVIRLQDEEGGVDFQIIKFLNRLSDYFFVLARIMARELGVEEVKWEH